MSEPVSKDRPRQVTLGGWVGGGASVAMLLSVFSLMARLRTVDVRDSLSSYLGSGTGRELGLSVDQALLLARIGLFAVGAVAAASAVLAFFVLRRDRPSRIVMTVLAVPMLLLGIFVDPFLAGFVVASTVLLWTRPAADWFAGRQPTPGSVVAAGPGRLDPRPPPLPPLPRQDGPAPYAAYGAPRAAHPSPPARAARPGVVLAACVLTWVSSALVAGAMVAVAVAIPRTDAVVDEVRRRFQADPALTDSGVSVHDVLVASQVLALLLAVWALAAMAVAVLALRGQGWARIALLVSAVSSGLVGLVATLAFPGFVLVAAAAAAVAVLLLRPAASRWYAERARPAYQPPTLPPPDQAPPDRPW